MRAVLLCLMVVVALMSLSQGHHRRRFGWPKWFRGQKRPHRKCSLSAERVTELLNLHEHCHSARQSFVYDPSDGECKLVRLCGRPRRHRSDTFRYRWTCRQRCAGTVTTSTPAPSCPTLTVDNGQVMVTEDGTKATLTCNHPYVLSNVCGSSVTCDLETGAWSGALGNCESVCPFGTAEWVEQSVFGQNFFPTVFKRPDLTNLADCQAGCEANDNCFATIFDPTNDACFLWTLDIFRQLDGTCPTPVDGEPVSDETKAFVRFCNCEAGGSKLSFEIVAALCANIGGGGVAPSALLAGTCTDDTGGQ